MYLVIVEYIKDGENGYIFESGNYNELMQKIYYVMEQGRNELYNIKINARKTYENNFKIEAYYEKLEAIIDAIV